MFGFLKRVIEEERLKRRPVDEVEYVVVDTELTGLDPKKDEMVSVGAIRMKGGSILLGEIFYREVLPKRLSTDAVVIHNILPSELKECPEVKRVIPELLEFMSGAVLVGYSLRIDIVFLKKHFEEAGVKFPKVKKVDVYNLHLWLKKKEWGRTRSSHFRKSLKVSQCWQRSTEWK